jgi:hypothetical protein
MQFLPFIAMLAVSPLVIKAMMAFNRLVRIESERFPKDWVADGKPAPFIWLRQAKDMPSTIRTSFATQRCALSWALMPPIWSKEHADARRYPRQLRMFFLLFNLIGVPICVLSALIASGFAG